MTFRAATADDADFFWYWRERAEQAQWYEGPLTTREQHQEWFIDRLERISLLVWMYGANELYGARGCVRIDSNGEMAFDGDPSLLATMLRELKYQEVGLGDRLKVTLDKGDRVKAKALKEAGFREYPVRFFCYRP